MKIQVEAVKKLFAKKNTYAASFGTFTEEGATKEEAKEKLLSALEWYFHEDNDQLIYKTIPEAGVTIILKRDFSGYEVQTIRHDGSNIIGCSSYGRITHRKALEVLESHAEGYRVQSA